MHTYTYAGVGSRETPIDMQVVMYKIARNIPAILHSGAAPGADTAFELGSKHNTYGANIFLPWKNFEKRLTGLKGFINYILPSPE